MSLSLQFDPGAVVVAGGSGGIGAGICRAFAACGVPVHFSFHNNAQKAEALVQEIESNGGLATCEATSLSMPEQVDALFAHAAERHGRIANVVYAAGPHFEFNFIGSIPNDEWSRVVDADIKGAFYTVQAAVRTFRRQGDGGNLLAVITAAVERVPVRDIMSAAPKAAIEMVMRGVAKEAGRFGIRANCVGPGWINAGLGKKGIEEKLNDEQRETIRKQTIPLQRFGQAEDIANAALFLCSRQAAYITGQSLAVDGGLQL
jgi:NAD(P)-dependent dehydrogenase (short-subunit alcohol dehydrogenase family)